MVFTGKQTAGFSNDYHRLFYKGPCPQPRFLGCRLKSVSKRLKEAVLKAFNLKSFSLRTCCFYRRKL